MLIMLSNSEIVEVLELTTKLMELHGIDPFRIRSFGAAAFNLDKYTDGTLGEMSLQELTTLQGVGKSMAGKILVIAETGHLPELDELMAKTPPGVLEMFNIKGIGPKKIAVIWKELGIDTIYDLEIACENGQVAQLKGFGTSTQQKILESITFLKNQAGKLRMDKAALLADELLNALRGHFERVELVGSMRRQMETVDVLEILIAGESPVWIQGELAKLPFLVQDRKLSSPFIWKGKAFDFDLKVHIYAVTAQDFVTQRFVLSASEGHLSAVDQGGRTLYKSARLQPFGKEEELYERSGLPYIVPEMREGLSEWDWSVNHSPEELVTWGDLRGILHNHSTYSDGKHSLEQMALFCRELGFNYLGIADHSQSAAYANGLKTEDVMRQHQEIDQLNSRFAAEAASVRPFRILKGIESDILGDGSLDYPDEVLATFDYIVASVHSNLSMTMDKATARLVRAIENPYTTILGHPTGRLLLSRSGYPVDYKTIIDACAERGVVIEINANPWRLDLDWRWISYCLEKNVMLAINPDAHETQGYFDMHYGVAVARKGGLVKGMTFNALSLEDMEAFLRNRKNKGGNI